MFHNSVIPALLLLVFLACDNQNNKPANTQQTSGKGETGARMVIDIEPKIFRASNLQVLYYDDPDGDSLRYNRFFTYSETNDTVSISKLLGEMNQAYTQYQQPLKCRSEGKFYLIDREDILKTVYFSRRTDSCSYMYFIKDGTFYYLPMTIGAKYILQELKKSAKKPAATPE